MINKNILKLIRLYVIGSLFIFAVAVAFWGYVAVNKAFLDKKLVDAQVEVYRAQAEQQGKPTIIEQRYYSPK